MPEITLHVVTNPYDKIISNEDLRLTITNQLDELTHSIHTARDAKLRGYPRADFAVVALNPVAPYYHASEDIVLFTAVIGDGESYLPNAASKVFESRDLQIERGIATHAAKQFCGSDMFRFGYAPPLSQSGGIPIAGSGLSESKDLKHAAELGRNVAAEIAKLVEEWEILNPEGGWYNKQNQPSLRCIEVLQRHKANAELVFE